MVIEPLFRIQIETLTRIQLNLVLETFYKERERCVFVIFNFLQDFQRYKSVLSKYDPAH